MKTFRMLCGSSVVISSAAKKTKDNSEVNPTNKPTGVKK